MGRCSQKKDLGCYSRCLKISSQETENQIKNKKGRGKNVRAILPSVLSLPVFSNQPFLRCSRSNFSHDISNQQIICERLKLHLTIMGEKYTHTDRTKTAPKTMFLLFLGRNTVPWRSFMSFQNALKLLKGRNSLSSGLHFKFFNLINYTNQRIVPFTLEEQRCRYETLLAL